ncbi:kinase-like domain-containing protein [Mycena galopus ATCC 62051]|nr:kinase-like domain-containing protein [Mycena galopus ATCC 62051]
MVASSQNADTTPWTNSDSAFHWQSCPQEQREHTNRLVEELKAPPLSNSDEETAIWNVYSRRYAIDLETYLIFSGLFLGVEIAFIAEIHWTRVRPHDAHSIVILCLRYIGLSSTYLASFLIILTQRWLRYDSAAAEEDSSKARGLEHQWELDGRIVIQMLAFPLRFALLLFWVPLPAYLWSIHPAIAITVLSLTVCGFAFVVLLGKSAVVETDSPFLVVSFYVLRTSRDLLPRFSKPRTHTPSPGAKASTSPSDVSYLNPLPAAVSWVSEPDPILVTSDVRPQKATADAVNHIAKRSLNRLKIAQNFINYTFSFPLQLSQSQLDEIEGQLEIWTGWDGLERLVGYHTIMHRLFAILKDKFVGDYATSSQCIAEQIFNELYQDAKDLHEQFASILRGRETYQTFLDCRDDSAQQLLDLLQDLLDLFPTSEYRPLLSQSLIRLSRASELHPACFPLAGVQANGQLVAGGGSSDIRTGLVLGQIVAVKIMRVFKDEVEHREATIKQFGREAVIWRQLSHRNVLPFFGMYSIESRLCLVSPWMSNGHIVEFLRNAPPGTDRVSLMLDIALGLEYLHSKHVVHGDLKGANILVTPSGRACLADFGLSSIIAMSMQFSPSPTGARGGTPRYQAPELLKCPESRTQFESDVYAVACVYYEILSGKTPFFEIKNYVYLGIQVLNGLRPTRPDTVPADDDLWLLLQDCWEEEPTDRPRVAQIIERLRAPLIGAKESQSSTDWDEKFSAKFRRSLQDRLILPSVAAIEQIIFGNDVCVNTQVSLETGESASEPGNWFNGETSLARSGCGLKGRREKICASTVVEFLIVILEPDVVQAQKSLLPSEK